MKKVNCFACYKGEKGKSWQLVSLYVKTGTTPSDTNSLLPLPAGKEFPTQHSMYECVMKTLAQNHMRVHSWEQFSARYYDVVWIDLETGEMNRSSYKAVAR